MAPALSLTETHNISCSLTSDNQCDILITAAWHGNPTPIGPYFATCASSLINTCTCEADVGWDNYPICDSTPAKALAALIIPLIIIICGIAFFTPTLVTVAIFSDIHADAVTPGYVMAWISVLLTLIITILFLARLFAPLAIMFTVQEIFRLGSLVMTLALVLHMGLSLLRISTVVRMRYSIEPHVLAISSTIFMAICFGVLEGFEQYFGSLILELSFTFLATVYFAYGSVMLAHRLTSQLIASISNELPGVCEMIVRMIPLAFRYDKPMYDLFGVTMKEAEDIVQEIYRRQSKREPKSRQNSKVPEIGDEAFDPNSRRSSKDDGSKHSRESSRDSKESKESKEDVNGNGSRGGGGRAGDSRQSSRMKRNGRKSVRTLFFGEPSLHRTGSKVLLSKGLADRRRDVMMFFSRTSRMCVWVVIFMLGRVASTSLIFALPELRWLGRALETGFQVAYSLVLLAYLDDVYVKRLTKINKNLERARKASKIAMQYMEQLEKKVNEEIKISVAPWLIQDDSMATNFDPKMVKTSSQNTRKSNLATAFVANQRPPKGSTLGHPSGGFVATLMSIGGARGSDLSASPHNSDLSSNGPHMQRNVSDLDRSPIFKTEAQAAIDPDLYVPFTQ